MLDSFSFPWDERDYTRELTLKSIPGHSPTCDWHSRQSRSNDEILTNPSRPSELEGRHVASPLGHPRKVDLESMLGSSHRKEDQEEALATPPLTGILNLNSSCLNDPMEAAWGWCSSLGPVKAALMGWRAALLSSRPLPVFTDRASLFEMCGAGSVSGFGIFEFWNACIYIMRYLGDRAQGKKIGNLFMFDMTWK